MRFDSLEDQRRFAAMMKGEGDNHDCLEHLKYELQEWTETHGLDCGPYEHCSQEIWRCTLCGEVFSASDLERAKQ